MLHYCIMINGRAKILLKKKVVVNDAISSKVSTLYPKPNTLLGIYRENLFPQQPSTSTKKIFCFFIFIFLYKHYLVTVYRFQLGRHLEEGPFFSCLFSPPSSVRLQALPGGVPTVLVSKVVKMQLHTQAGSPSPAGGLPHHKAFLCGLPRKLSFPRLCRTPESFSEGRAMGRSVLGAGNGLVTSRHTFCFLV